MHRREFIRRNCLICLGGGMFSVTLEGCMATHYATGVVEPNGLSVLKAEFTYLKKEETMTRKYIIVQNEKLEFPIYLYRL